MKTTITIENKGGIWHINDKRLGYDELSDLERMAINEFIKEYKQLQKQKNEKI